MAEFVGQIEIVMTPDAASLAAQAAERIVAAAAAAIAARGRFTLVLSGGSTPEKLFALLSQPDWKSRIDWSRTWLFFGDERCVPHNDDRSNFHLAAKSLLEPAKIDPQHVIGIPTDLGTPADCAAKYELMLKAFFASAGNSSKDRNSQPNSGFANFDVILLGLGDDGHTASLFPSKPTLDETKLWVTWSPPGVLPPPVDRVTFTFPLINAARLVMFLVAGPGKAAIVHEVLDGPADFHKHPATGVRPSAGQLIWMLDEAAAAALSRQRGASPAAKK